MTTGKNIQPTDTQPTDSWHIVKQVDGHCKIVSQTELAQGRDQTKTWGPFTNRADAIAKRVGLIRAGKCLPQ
ncbi:hypothetical protein IQ260_22435 [Leptolyngbya cf. ectocarpi LEGE 11479]|uniref:DDE transposase family protein n=1 Tax=Leptolyngbya cf. ectocarpi LEGE 11479 TaxID=1828722 RepID=A0A928ZXP2_LEPEC|nr:hypothetical protein [Leptolyngbya ectocarpi]MBE9069407.1 hypothetical protein [Leptolyngbya cf. ectocarpi LEGE 11479]